MTDKPMNPRPDFESPIVERKHGISWIWLLPLVALLLGAWLIYRSVVEAGIDVYITFDSAEGIEEGKTKIIYKGLKVGTVTKITFDEDLQSVTVTAEVVRDAESGLRENTKIWLVTPRISLTGVSGLDTLVSGNYIAAQPGDGEPTRHFKALSKPPPLSTSAPGLHVKLRANELGSVDRGTQVYYRQIPVGEVQDYELAENNDEIVINVHINPNYEHLVKKNSRFWNSSGLTVKASLSGVQLKTESLAALIAGGITFYTPDSESTENTQNGDEFPLYQDYDSAEVGIPVKILFAEASGLEEGATEVKYNGFNVGFVKKLDFNEDLKGVVANVMFNPHASNLLKEETQFWLERPQISLTGVSGLTTLLKGPFINLRPGKGKTAHKFVAMESAPTVSPDAPGLRLTLQAKELSSLERGNAVLYKKVEVGTIEDYQLTPDGRTVLVKLHIKQQFAHLVNQQTRFWNASGVNIRAGLTQFDIRTGSLSSLLSGGVAFASPAVPANASKVKNGAVFHLYEDFQSATDGGALFAAQRPAGLEIDIHAEDLGSLAAGSPILYKKVQIGEITGFRLDTPQDQVILHGHIRDNYAPLVKKESRFWNASGVSVEASLSGVKLSTESVNSVIAGGVAFFTPNQASPTTSAVNGDTFKLFKDSRSAAEDSQGIEILFSQGQGLKEGAAIKFQGIDVGKVATVRLAEREPGILVKADLFGKAKDFARAGASFWIVGPELSIENTANLDTLISGPYIEIRPGRGPNQLAFEGLNKVPTGTGTAIDRGLLLTLITDNLGSLKPGNPIYYRQIPVGRVINYELSRAANRVIIHAAIEDRFAPLVRENSQFWNASGVAVDFGLFDGLKIETESFTSLLSGGIGFATPGRPQMGKPAVSGQVFELHNEVEPEWLTWAPAIRTSRR